MDKEVELILSKLKIVSEEQERGMYLCDKEHSKLLLDYITNLQQENENNIKMLNNIIKEQDGKLNYLQQKLEEYKDTETYSKRFLYKANKDRLNANLELVKENERLKLEKDTKSASEIICENLYDVYKSRCEKAVEYLEKEKSNYMRSCDISNATNREGLIISSAVRTCDDTLNILNGRSDE